MTKHSIERIAEWLLEAAHPTAFTGAGISTESGIPDFRSPKGVWQKSRPVYFDEFLTSYEARKEYWHQKCEASSRMRRAKPNTGHRVLARWEASGDLRGVITQNIDGLHETAGNRSLLELHGTARKVACLDCPFREGAHVWEKRFVLTRSVPDCPECGGLLKHATISFGQSLPEEVLQTAQFWCTQTGLLLALGSSLVVSPAADLPRIAKQAGARLVIINHDSTPLDSIADVVLNRPLGETLTAIEQVMRRKQQAGITEPDGGT